MATMSSYTSRSFAFILLFFSSLDGILCGVSSICAGQQHTCAILRTNSASRLDGGLACWGYSPYGQLDQPVISSLSLSFLSISCGGFHSCGILSDHSVSCFGYNGGFGNGVPHPETLYNQSIVPEGILAEEVALTQTMTCALIYPQRKKIQCWGYSDYLDVAVPFSLPSNNEILTFECGAGCCCMIDKVTGLVHCVGHDVNNRLSPPNKQFLSLSSHWNDLQTCGITTAYQIECWGDGDAAFGLSQQTSEDIYSFAVLPGSGQKFVVGVESSSGAPKAWGEIVNNLMALNIRGGTQFTQLAFGFDHGCGVNTELEVYCWTGNKYKLQPNKWTVPTATFTDIASAIDISGSTTCVLIEGNSFAYCFGQGQYGQADALNSIDHLGYKSIVSSNAGSCAIVNVHSTLPNVICWGSITESGSTPPTYEFLALSMSRVFTVCGIIQGVVPSTATNLVCWGRTDLDSATPQLPAPSSGTFTKLCSGFNFHCGLLSNGTMLCFLSRANTDNSDPANNPNIAPQPDLTLNFTNLFCSYYFVCGILASPGGYSQCFGSNLNSNLLPPAEESFDSLSLMSPSIGCGILASNGPARCWPESSPAVAPYLTLLQNTAWAKLAVGNSICGITIFNQLNCVGTDPFMVELAPSYIQPSIAYAAPKNYYQRGIDFVECRNGSFARNPGYTQQGCSGPCTAGYYGAWPQNEQRCEAICPLGHFCGTGVTQPTACPAGKLGVVQGLSSSECSGIVAAGFYAPAASAQAIACSAGHYLSTPGGTSAGDCLLCDPGYYCVNGSTSARQLICPSSAMYCLQGSGVPATVDNGYYGTGGSANGQGAKQKVICEAGSYCVGGQKFLCNPGKYSNSGQSACSSCDPGSFSADFGLTGCSNCTQGFYQPLGSTTTCFSCSPGTFQPFNSSLRCLDCDPGKYSESPGATVCVDCAVGKFTDQNSSISCRSCNPGSYQPQPGSSFCIESVCALGYKTSSTGCIACDQGEFTATHKSSECSTCAAGFYNLRAASSSCFSCADDADVYGLVCSGGNGTVQAGYWATIVLDSAGEPHYKVYTCSSDNNCKGNTILSYFGPFGSNSSQITQTQLNSFIMSSGGTASQCGQNRASSSSNYLCGSCDPGFTEWNGSCVECEGVKVWLIVIFIIIGFIYVIILHSVSQSSSGDVKILLYFIQTALLVLAASVKDFKWLEFVNFSPSQSTGTYCAAPLTSYQQLALQAVIPFIFIGQLLLLALLHWLSSLSCRANRRAVTPQLEVSHVVIDHPDDLPSNSVRREPARPLKQFYWPNYHRTLVALILFSFQMITQTCFDFIQCVSINSESSVLYSRPDISCKTQQYRDWSILIYILFAGYVALVPLIILGFLWSSRAQLSSKRNSSALLEKWGILFEMFTARAYWWQFIVLARQILLIGLNMAFFDNPGQKYVSFTYFFLVMLLAHAVIKPYCNSADNFMEGGSLALLTMISAFFIHTAGASLSLNQTIWVGILLFPYISASVLKIGGYRVADLYQHAKH
jgi:hypothetical protein